MASSQVQNSGSIAVTTGQQILANPRSGYLHLVAVSAQGASTATITAYDSAQTSGAPSGTVLASILVPTTWTDRFDFGGAIQFNKGLYVVVAGTGAIGQITYE
jgi:hypothetical protein